ncbi:hypothetical protein G9A89_016602 [Geosiphon pyriformis]|nr:hypothetical protein G9A89_016602 [Geosiphon pyriformis]
MSEQAHNTNAEFDLRYPKKDAFKLEPHLYTSYIIEPNKKIAQTIFLFLVKIAQLVSVGNKKELGITARGIQGFGFTEKTIIGYLTTEIEDQLPNTIADFLQLCGYIDITSQTIYGQEKYYLLQPKQLEQMNLGNLDPLQYMQLKVLLNNFNNIFANKNEFGRTDIIQHQIKIGNAMPIKQKA